MKPTLRLTAEEVRNVLDYDPETGILTWRAGRKFAGKAAGTVHKTGYLVIWIGQQGYAGHRLAWAHYTGEWPTLLIDHINRNKLDNRIANLRLANYQQNAANSAARRISAPKGAYRRASGNWQSEIRKNGRVQSLGTFPTQEDAATAYLREAISIHGAFARLT